MESSGNDGKNEVVFTNKLKSLPVTIKKYGVNGPINDSNTDVTENEVEAIFTMQGVWKDGSSLVTTMGPNNNTIFESGKKYGGHKDQAPSLTAGDYALKETMAAHYKEYVVMNEDLVIKLVGEANEEEHGLALRVENGTGGTAPGVTWGPNPDVVNGALVKVYNYKAVKLIIQPVLEDPLLDQNTFTFVATYEITDENGNPVTVTLDPFDVTNGGKEEIYLPVGATEVTIKEVSAADTTGGTNPGGGSGNPGDPSNPGGGNDPSNPGGGSGGGPTQPMPVDETYTSTVTRENGGNEKDEKEDSHTYSFPNPLTPNDDGDVLTFKNTRRTTQITVEKKLRNDVADRSGTFDFTARLTGSGSAPVKNYNVGYEIPDGSHSEVTSTHDSKEATTNESGEIAFTLKENDSILLSIPVGAGMTLTESADGYAAEIGVVRTHDNSNYTEGDREGKQYSLASVPNVWLTVTYKNGPGGMDVKFKKIDGFGNPLPGAKFSLYRDYRMEETTRVSVTVNGTSTMEWESGSAESEQGEGIVFMEKVPTGVYYMKETEQPSGFEKNENQYILLVGDAASQNVGSVTTLPCLAKITQYDIAAQTGTYSKTEVFGAGFDKYAIFLIVIDSTTGEAMAVAAPDIEKGSPNTAPAPDIAKYGVLNISTAKRKVILKKTDQTHTPKKDMTFEVYRADMSMVTEGTVTTSANGAFLVENLP